jgi:hypothetical protein
LGDSHECLDCSVSRQAAAQEEEAVAHEQALQELWQRMIEVDITVITISLIILRFIENSLGCII